MKLVEITKQKYAMLVPAQQSFYDELIRKGQAVIVADSASSAKPEPAIADTTTPEEPKKEKKPLSPVQALQGKKVNIQLVRGDNIVGVLKQVWQYELDVKTEHGHIIVMKHAVMTMESAP
jgi:sRNA-binding regulator protein Hfq